MMDKFTILNGMLNFGPKVIGPATALYCAPSELKGLTERQAVVHTVLPFNIDVVFVAEDKVVGVELKRGQDLSSSHDTHRLSRQLATIGNTCDVVVLGISNAQDVPVDFEQDMVAYQMMGVILVNLPSTPRLVVAELAQLRPVFGGTRAILAPFKWFDIELKPNEQQREKRGWLLRTIPGIGEKLSLKLLDKFGSTMVALNATDEQWEQLKIPRRVIDIRREALQ